MLSEFNTPVFLIEDTYLNNAHELEQLHTNQSLLNPVAEFLLKKKPQQFKTSILSHVKQVLHF